MRVVQDIPVGAIQMDRHSLTPATLELVQHLQEGGEVPPIHVARLPAGNYRICDGRAPRDSLQAAWEANHHRPVLHRTPPG